MSAPTKDAADEAAALRARLALAVAARDDLQAQCQHLLALVAELQQRVRWLEAQRGDGSDRAG
ncbi:MAG: hypothetical protein ACK5AL_01640 [Planctomycetota bacterium]